MANSMTSSLFNKDEDLIAVFADTEAPLDPGYVSGPKIRDCFIIEYCHTGKGVLTVNSNSFDISAGQCFMLFPDVVVTMTTDTHDPWGKSWVCLYGTRIPKLLKRIGVTAETPVFSWSDRPEVLEEIHNCIKYVSGICIPNEFDQKICANRLFKALTNAYTDNVAAPQNTLSQSEYIKHALQFIEYNFAERISVDDISAHLGLSRTYFSTLFREIMKISPQEYILKKRIDKACNLFANPNSTVNNVACSLGYEPTVFSRFFKKRMGMSPIEYKNSLKATERNPDKD